MLSTYDLVGAMKPGVLVRDTLGVTRRAAFDAVAELVTLAVRFAAAPPAFCALLVLRLAEAGALVRILVGSFVVRRLLDLSSTSWLTGGGGATCSSDSEGRFAYFMGV